MYRKPVAGSSPEELIQTSEVHQFPGDRMPNPPRIRLPGTADRRDQELDDRDAPVGPGRQARCDR